jgi:2,3-bisphosphoglycerate-independent phosphoglycerate mutase
LDGLGDRAHASLGHRTPLQAADTPFLDELAARGAQGLYHAGRVGQPLPSENAHYAIFGRATDFPGRGALEALGAGAAMAPGDVAVLAHLASVRAAGGALVLDADEGEPLEADEAEIAALYAALDAVADESDGVATAGISDRGGGGGGDDGGDGVRIRVHRTRGRFAVLVLSGRVSPHVTDTGVMVPGLTIPDVLPWAADATNPAAVATADALRAFLRRAHRALEAHPVNAARRAASGGGHGRRDDPAPLNFLVTQRAGRLTRVPSLRASCGLRCLSASSGPLFRGMAAHLGMTHVAAPRSGDVRRDYAATIRLALERAGDHDLLHIHTKAPDEAAHARSPEAKRDVIAALDRAMAEAAGPLLDDPEALIVVASDHSTPSSGRLIHGGEPVPLLFYGQGVRRDAAASFDEIAAATGALGAMRGEEMLLLILNFLDRAKLGGIMDTPQDQPYFPGDAAPFTA